MARALRAGMVYVNCYDADDITVPFGGFRQSGMGRDKSLHAFDKYTELKTTWIDCLEPALRCHRPGARMINLRFVATVPAWLFGPAGRGGHRAGQGRTRATRWEACSSKDRFAPATTCCWNRAWPVACCWRSRQRPGGHHG
jgi:hypothetical protein